MEGGMAADDKEAELLERKLVLLGTDVGSIPCFRNSFLYGVTSGFVGGIGHFAFTSKIRKSTSFGFWTYIGVTLSYWAYCRYTFSATKMHYEKLKYAMQQNAILEGTPGGIGFQLKSETEASPPEVKP